MLDEELNAPTRKLSTFDPNKLQRKVTDPVLWNTTSLYGRDDIPAVKTLLVGNDCSAPIILERHEDNRLHGYKEIWGAAQLHHVPLGGEVEKDNGRQSPAHSE